MELFEKVAKGFLKLLTVFSKRSTLDVWLVPVTPLRISNISPEPLAESTWNFQYLLFYLFERQKYKTQTFFISENCHATPFNKITIFTHFIGKVISFDITLFDNIYLNYNGLRLNCTILNLWVLIYVQPHLHNWIIIFG